MNNCKANVKNCATKDAAVRFYIGFYIKAIPLRAKAGKLAELDSAGQRPEDQVKTTSG